jgi:hypothetical protein
MDELYRGWAQARLSERSCGATATETGPAFTRPALYYKLLVIIVIATRRYMNAAFMRQIDQSMLPINPSRREPGQVSLERLWFSDPFERIFQAFIDQFINSLDEFWISRLP